MTLRVPAPQFLDGDKMSAALADVGIEIGPTEFTLEPSPDDVPGWGTLVFPTLMGTTAQAHAVLAVFEGLTAADGDAAPL